MSRLTTVTRYFITKPLGVAYESLEPSISERTMRLHHDKHYAGYVDNLNRLVDNTRYAAMTLEEVLLSAAPGPIFNNAAQAWNHQFYFNQFSPTPLAEPRGDLLEAIEASFGSFDDMIAQIQRGATSLFGSGWLWLVINDDERLELIGASNAANPLVGGNRPLMTLDVWEHAYYVDYENRRTDAIKEHLTKIDWEVIEGRYRFSSHI